MNVSRRRLISLTVPLLGVFADSGIAQTSRRLRVMITGGHPGDPECGCGGTIARYADLGHDVILLYMNRGEGYCQGTESTQCGPVRTAEALRACKILKARAAFLSQTDGRAVVDNEHYEDFRRMFDKEQPDVVFTHWPIDTHRDHRAISTLALDAWLRSGKNAAFYYYEVAYDTMMYSPASVPAHPMEFVDISAVEDRRHAACYAHASQNPDKWYPAQTEITRARGKQSGFTQAEGFIRHWDSKIALLP